MTITNNKKTMQDKHQNNTLQLYGIFLKTFLDEKMPLGRFFKSKLSSQKYHLKARDSHSTTNKS